MNELQVPHERQQTGMVKAFELSGSIKGWTVVNKVGDCHWHLRGHHTFPYPQRKPLD